MKNSLVELHCHILPGIDDGARDLDMSMSLMRREVSDGVVGVVFTPHFHYERITVEKFVELRKAAFRQVAAAVRTEGLRVAGKLGAEVYYSTALPSLDLSKLAFADTSYILIEFPTTIQPPGIGKNREFHKNNYSAPICCLCRNCAIRKIIGENGQGSTYIQDW